MIARVHCLKTGYFVRKIIPEIIPVRIERFLAQENIWQQFVAGNHRNVLWTYVVITFLVWNVHEPVNKILERHMVYETVMT